MEPILLSLDEVLEIHDQQIQRYGGSQGLRGAAGLESAVATPQATFGGEYVHAPIPARPAAVPMFDPLDISAFVCPCRHQDGDLTLIGAVRDIAEGRDIANGAEDPSRNGRDVNCCEADSVCSVTESTWLKSKPMAIR